MTNTQPMEANAAVRKLQAHDLHAIEEVLEFRGEITLVVFRARLLHVAELLRGDAELAFAFLSDITGVDRFPVEPRFEVNYHLVSLERRERLRLKVRLGSSDPVIPSVTPVWPTANWHEREVFDLFGVRFEGHPDLRRILMPESWEGHPLRKDYPVEGYR
jgi:NADH-quinone oxidoreductase subunit C